MINDVLQFGTETLYTRELKAYGGDNKAPEFCWCCGRRLKRSFFHYKYSEKTGLPLLGIKLDCPAPWYMQWQAHTHDKFDPNGNEIIERFY